MGWLFGWPHRADLVQHLTEGNGVKTLKKCFTGNDMWCVHESVDQQGKTVRFACLYMMRREEGRWGYKDIDESAGPYNLSFPLSYLKLLTPAVNDLSAEWRANVEARGLKAKSFKKGSRWYWKDPGSSVFEIVKRTSPSIYLLKIVDGSGTLYTFNLRQLLNATEVTHDGSPEGIAAAKDGGTSGGARGPVHSELAVTS